MGWTGEGSSGVNETYLEAGRRGKNNWYATCWASSLSCSCGSSSGVGQASPSATCSTLPQGRSLRTLLGWADRRLPGHQRLVPGVLARIRARRGAYPPAEPPHARHRPAIRRLEPRGNGPRRVVRAGRPGGPRRVPPLPLRFLLGTGPRVLRAFRPPGHRTHPDARPPPRRCSSAATSCRGRA